MNNNIFKASRYIFIMLAMTIATLVIASCGRTEDDYSIEDALQKEWDTSNANSAVGAVDCNVFSLNIEKVEGDTYYVSYKLKSKYASGESKTVKLTGAKLNKDSNGKYTVETIGY